MMMKRIFCILLMFVSASSFAAQGPLFTTVVSGNTLVVTPSSFHTYYMGIKLTSGQALNDCEAYSDGFCLFTASKAAPKTLKVVGVAGDLTGEGCLNGPAHISCQRINISRSPSSVCSSAGGKIVVGSSACWISKEGPGSIPSPHIFDCTSVCTEKGLLLQKQTNSGPLSRAVCDSFGFTDPPFVLSGPVVPFDPSTFTVVYHEDIAGPPPGSRECLWSDSLVDDWTNPFNDGLTVRSTYFCPCGTA
jgi:hypothetical protein